MAAVLCPRCKNPLDIPKPVPERIRCGTCGVVIRTTTAAHTGQAPVRPLPATVAKGPQPATVARGPAVNTAVMEKTNLVAGPTRPQPPAEERQDNGEPEPEMADYSNRDASAPRRNWAVLIAVLGGCLLLASSVIGLGAWALFSSGRGPQGRNSGETNSSVANVPSEARPNQQVAPNLGQIKSTGPKIIELKPREPRVQSAVDRGVAYLRKHVPERIRPNQMEGGDDTGFLSLAGLALLECNVPADDPLIKQMADVIRRSLPVMNRTYAVAPSILFLDRLHRGDASAQDRKIIQTLGMRLVAGITQRGIWGYEVKILDAKAEEKLRSQLRGHFTGDVPLSDRSDGDMSNTQFAALALWVARKYDVPVQGVLTKAAATIRTAAQHNACTYMLQPGQSYRDTANCVGLIVLSLGRAVAEEKEAGDFRDDPPVKKAIAHLAAFIDRDLKKHGGKIVTKRSPIKADALGDLYFLWALERTALILKLDKFGDHDWHAWGSEVILQNQKDDGSWASGHPGLPDTSFALLFLVRANLFQDLTDKLDLSAADGILDSLSLASSQ